MTDQLSLITLTVTPDDARKIQTALTERQLHFSEIGFPDISDDYRRLRRKIASQSRL